MANNKNAVRKLTKSELKKLTGGKAAANAGNYVADPNNAAASAAKVGPGGKPPIKKPGDPAPAKLATGAKGDVAPAVEGKKK